MHIHCIKCNIRCVRWSCELQIGYIKILHILFCFGLLATRQMIPELLFDSGSDYVQVNWIRPKFLPEMYKLNYVCSMKPTYMPLLEKVLNLCSNTTSFRIYNLHASSICSLCLFAVYNPASIDPGIVITGTMSDEKTSM